MQGADASTMFGRRTKRATAPGSVDLAPAEAVTVDPVAPLRAPDAGRDAGLAKIEAEFAISDDDLALLDLSSIAFDQQTKRLSAADAIMAENRAALADFMSRLNNAWSAHAVSPVDLQPYFMLPERCWEGDHQEVLVEVLGLAPAQPWNVIPLAADSATEAIVGVGRHPGSRALDHRAMATSLIAETVGTMHKTVEQAAFAKDAVDTSAFDAARLQAANEIKGIARRIAGATVGVEVIDHARATFFKA